jgi:hypothetical protein
MSRLLRHLQQRYDMGSTWSCMFCIPVLHLLFVSEPLSYQADQLGITFHVDALHPRTHHT